MTKNDFPQDGSISDFFHWINERQRMYLKKEAGKPWPWTDDPILRDYFFCNVYREQDTVTKWIAENWRNRKAPPNIMIFNMIVARFFNWPPTLKSIGWTKDWEKKRTKVYWDLAERSNLGQKIFSEAYLIAGTDLKGKSKIEGVIDRLDWAWEHRKEIADEITGKINHGFEGEIVSLAKAWWCLQQIPGVAGFIAYEIVTELRHTPVLQNAPDIMTWANPGPGAVRGLQRIYGRGPVRELGALEFIRTLLEIAPKYTKLKLEMRDIEHSLCEMDKKLRIEQAIREGRPVLGMRKYRRKE